MKNDNKEKLIKELLEVISDGPHEIREEKKIAYDKTTQQFSIKIPKSIALKAKVRDNSVFEIIFNPKESKEKIDKSQFVIYLKEEKDGEGEKAA